MRGPGAPSRHSITRDDFAALAAGGGDGRIVARFWASERSWRLLVLRPLFDACAGLPGVTGPLPALNTVLDLLARAFQADPASCEDVLAQPQVGVWAAHTLRRVGEPAPAGPLWPDVGYLHALAVACAVRAGIPFELAIPVRDGTAVVPTVGAATFPRGAAHVRASGDGKIFTLDDGTVTVRAGPDDPRWHEPVRIDVEAQGVGLRLTLLDRDHYRDLKGPSAPQPLQPAEVDRWRGLLGAAWPLLVREQPERAEGIAASLRCLAPLPKEARFRQRSASGGEAFGGVLLSEPDDATQLAVTLVHEGQHHKLGALLHLFPLTDGDPEVRYYAPWRDDPRPIEGLLQGVYAFVGITDFWRAHRHHREPAEAALAHFEFALWRRQAFGAARVLAGSGRLTEAGRRFVDGLLTTLAFWQDAPVPPDILALAESMALDHYAGWRASSIPVPASAAASLIAAFRQGEPAPVAVLAETDQNAVKVPEVAWLDGRAVLVRHRLTDPAGAAPARVAGGTPADAELIRGRLPEARAGYLRDLGRDPRNPHAWIGLGLTLDRRADPAARALLGRPELLVAMAEARPDPLAVARWLGEALPDDLLGRPKPAGWRVS